MNLFAFGLGYSARHWIATGRFARAGGTVTTREKAEALRAGGIEVFVLDEGACDPGILAAVGDSDAILTSVPPDEGGDPVLEQAEAAIAGSRAGWIGYLSTIGVYGDRGGGWIDETAEPDPPSERTRRRVAAEEAWLALGRRTGKAVQVFRLSGIYGPGRSAVDQLRAGTARRIVKPGQVFNRIHVEDIAAVLSASLDRPRPGAIYNLADDEPAPPQDVVAHAAALLGVEPPPEIPFDPATLPAMTASFYGANKRVRNDVIKRELGVTLAYPTYREGLAAIAGRS
ncbi:SDR family oxidoreductase [Salinarimonas soli]|uniref:SDR family oxidoreductase n=1 Tax=Salinarimonas soli TaxID=1638099 RepID=A0A5B2VUZ0_9HYPH|nr:SDR family oxidoreductase [Salinarimonas soli]KAA2242077.1 SDR family oxidoreductase [Salinarimonas soli]